MNTKTWEGIEVVVACAVVCVASLYAGSSGGKMLLRQEAAKEGVGEYSVNPLTGSTRFQWKQSDALQANTITVTNDPSPSATALALKFSVDNAENLSGLVKLSEAMVQKIIDLSRRVAELEQKLYPRWDGQVLTNTWPPQWGTSTNIEIIQSGTNIYMTNGMLYIQN